MPFFSSLLGSTPVGRFLWIFGPLIVAVGFTPYLATGLDGLCILAVLVLFAATWAVWRVRRAVPWKAMSELARKAPFAELSLPPEGLFTAGARMYFRLPDTDVGWAEVRLPKAARLQLAAQRRVWLLGPDDGGRRFLQLPGVLWPHLVKVVPELPGDARPLDAAEPRLAPPEEDVVLIAHRTRIVRTIRSLIAAWVVLLVLATVMEVLAYIDVTDGGSGSLVLVMYGFVGGVIGLNAVKGMLKPLPRRKWTEMVAVPLGMVYVNPVGLASVVVRVQWPNGWWSDVSLLKVDPALAANIWATQRIWIIGEPFRGAATFAGLPGHAVLGRVRIN